MTAGRVTGLRALALSALGVAAAALSPHSASAAETKSWVVSWFSMAMYSQEGDCKDGLNPKIEDVYRGLLTGMGKTPKEIDALFAGPGSLTGGAVGALIINRGNVDGKPANVYAHPESVPDPNIHLVTGKFAYGFNLDGKGAASPNTFEDPDTHEKTVNNQLVRVIGCTGVFRATPPERSLHGGAFQWETVRPAMPAWLVSVTGEDLGKDGDVTITFDRALKHVVLNGAGETLADMTFQTDSDPRSRNVFHGKIKDGVIAVESGDFHMMGDPYYMEHFNIASTHLRLQLKPDGTLHGFLGGYQPWLDIYSMYGVTGFHLEPNVGADFVGIYYGLKKLADADPDPKTGQNLKISATYQIDAVPAFVLPPAAPKPEKTAQAQ